MNRWQKKLVRQWRRNPLWVSFLYSCLLHLLIYALWRFGVMELPDRLARLFIKRRADIAQLTPPRATNAPALPKEIPLVFIEVEPDQSTSQSPRDAKFYSHANSAAANPEPKRDTALPQVDGRQDRIAKLRDVPRPVLPPPEPPPPTVKPVPVAPPLPPAPKPEMTLQPAPPKEIPKPKEEPPPPPPGNTEVVKATEPPKPAVAKSETLPPLPDPEPPPPPRPRTLAAARQQAGIAGEKMRQEGGVRRPGRLSVDAKATPFGEYDRAFIAAVQERWYALIDSCKLSPRTGKVILQFNLKFDGTITDLKVKETEVGEPWAILCQRAIIDPSPYPKWPSDMHQLIGGMVRPVSFTFLYY